MMEQIIAHLTGQLKFNVDTSGLHKFQLALNNIERKMKQVGVNSRKLETALGLSGTADNQKAASTIALQQKRELKADKAIDAQRKRTLAAELQAQGKLVEGDKARSAIQQATHKALEQAATALAYPDKATRPKGRPADTQKALEASQARLARLEQIKAKTSAIRMAAEDRHAKSLTNMQRLQLSLEEARAKLARNAIRAQRTERRTSRREARQEEKHAMAQQRFQWAVERHQAASSGVGGTVGSPAGLTSGITGLVASFGVLGAAAYGLSAGFGALRARIDQRQADVVETQDFNGVLRNLDKDEARAANLRDRFIKVQTSNAAAIDTETARDFSNLYTNSKAMGKSDDDIFKTWETRQKAFATVGMKAPDRKEIGRQMNLMASGDGKGDKQDYDQITDRMNVLIPYIADQYGKEHNIKDRTKALAAMNRDLKGGKGWKNSWLEGAMNAYVDENSEAFQRGLGSVASQQQLSDNQAFLQKNSINSDQELSDVLKGRIKAEQELNEAMQPLQKTLAAFDLGLSQVATAMLRIASNKNVDGSEKTEQQKTQHRMTTMDLPVSLEMVGTHDYSKVDAETQHQGGWIGEFWNWFLSVDEKRQAKQLAGKIAPLAPSIGAPVMPNIDFTPQLDAMKGLHTAPPTTQTDAQQAQSQQTAQSIVNNTETNVTAPVTVTNNVTVNAETADPEGLARRLSPLLQYDMERAGHRALSDAISTANAGLKDNK